MEVLFLLIVVWVIGLLITVLHESAHVLFSGGYCEYVQIGIPIGFRVQFGKYIFYPLFPFGGNSKIRILNPTRSRIILCALTGVVIGCVTAGLIGTIGFYLLPPDALAELVKSRKLGFLMARVINGAGIQTTIATSFIASSILYGVQQAGNLLPVPGYDGHLVFTTLRRR